MGRMSAQVHYRRPESVLVLVYTVAGDVLLLRRRQPFQFWQSVTGSLEPGETPAAGAARELLEETGLSADGELYFSGNRRVFEIDPRWKHRYAPSVAHNTEFEWRYRLPAARAIRIDASEHAGYCWAPLASAVDTVWSWTNKEALQSLRSEL